MTGFRFSWSIENPTLIWTSSISEVGRSIQTHDYGDTFAELVDPSPDHIYSSILKIPEGFQGDIGNDTLVIELNVEMRDEDEVAWSMSYKLYRKHKTWVDADAHCKSEGGQLASIHSKWEQEMAEKTADGICLAWR